GWREFSTLLNTFFTPRLLPVDERLEDARALLAVPDGAPGLDDRVLRGVGHELDEEVRLLAVVAEARGGRGELVGHARVLLAGLRHGLEKVDAVVVVQVLARRDERLRRDAAPVEEDLQDLHPPRGVGQARRRRRDALGVVGRLAA